MIVVVGMELYDTGACKLNVVSIRGIGNLLAPMNHCTSLEEGLWWPATELWPQL